MKQKIEYDVITSREAVASIEHKTSPFLDKMNKAMAEGWEPHGPTHFETSSATNIVFIRQPIVRRIENE